MIRKYLLFCIILLVLLGDSFGQRKKHSKRYMETNPEYLAWLKQYGDSLAADDPRFPRMQPNPEYLEWLADRDERNESSDQEDRPPLVTTEVINELEEQLESEGQPDMPSSPNRPNKDLMLGLSYTATGYYGDLNYSESGLFSSSFINFHPGMTITLRQDGPRLLLPSFHMGYGRFVAQNPDLAPVRFTEGDIDTLIKPNTYAETDLIHGDFILLFNPLRKISAFRPYIGAGIGGLAFFPKADDGILLFRKRSTRAPSEASYGTLAVSIPIMAGFDYHLSRKLSLSFGYLYRFNTTDYLDNIGLLGRHEGNDQLHIFRLGLNFRIFDASEY